LRRTLPRCFFVHQQRRCASPVELRNYWSTYVDIGCYKWKTQQIYFLSQFYVWFNQIPIYNLWKHFNVISLFVSCCCDFFRVHISQESFFLEYNICDRHDAELILCNERCC
jgi:hypothetical protein